MARIPETWPLLLDRDQLCAFINVPSDTIERILDVAPIDLGDGVLRWNRLQVEEWAQALKPKIQKSDRNEKRRTQRAQRKRESEEGTRNVLIGLYRNFVKHTIKRIDKRANASAKDDPALRDPYFVYLHTVYAADLLCVCGESEIPLFERMEREFAAVNGSHAALRLDRRPVQIRARAIVQATKELMPEIRLLSSSLAERQAPRRSRARRQPQRPPAPFE